MTLVNDIIGRSNATIKEANSIVKHFEKAELKRKEILHNRKTICDRYFFLEKGLLRFSMLNGTKDDTAWIVFENSFFTDIFSLYDNTNSFFDIIALEKSTVYSIQKDKLNELAIAHPSLQEYLRKTWEHNFRNIAEIKLLNQIGDAKQRYAFFLKNQKWMKRVPQKLLASFIGITPYSLSRIRRAK